MIRLGLCCLFHEAPIKFRTTTAKAMLALPRAEAQMRLAALCRANAESLRAALQFCASQGIGSFRVNSQILPLATHPVLGYRLADLPDGPAIVSLYEGCGRLARRLGMRTTFHPDQFVVLNSPRPEVVQSSIAELEYQAEAAQWIGADVINVHGGGVFGDKRSALEALATNLRRLSRAVRRRLTLENDDRCYTPADLLTFCQRHRVPLVYDVHHHRCLADGLSCDEATRAALGTWDREPLFHISSPLEGWLGPKPHRHHDYINPADFPAIWRGLDITVEVEAKAKELAVAALKAALC